jgi:ABC-type lipoprotein export system ATPase subunit
MGGNLQWVLRDANITVTPGERVIITGPSGAGKSTLLHLLAGLDEPTSGQVHVLGQDLSRLGTAARDRFRLTNIGFVFQFFSLLPALTALENVCLPAVAQGHAYSEVRSRALGLLSRFGLEKRAGYRPHELSGGEIQRCVIARAVLAEPAVIFADEPTGNLDQANGQQVMECLAEVANDGIAIVLVTHDASHSDWAIREVRIVDGFVLPAASA